MSKKDKTGNRAAEDVLPAHRDEIVPVLREHTSERVADVHEQGKRSPARFIRAMGWWKSIFLRDKNIDIDGIDNLESAQNGKGCIIACSHISDSDVPATAAALCENADLILTNQSIQHRFWGDPISNIGMRVAGPDNFLPISYEGEGDHKHGIFKPNDYVPMKQAMEERDKAILMAAHNPSFGVMPEHGGIGVIFLAQISKESMIVPVAMILESPNGYVPNASEGLENFKAENKPKARLVIGKPFRLEHIIGIEKLPYLLALKHDLKPGDRQMTSEGVMKLEIIWGKLKEQSNELMKRIAELMPPEKRGKW